MADEPEIQLKHPNLEHPDDTGAHSHEDADTSGDVLPEEGES